MPFKSFSVGELATSSDVNTFLMKQAVMVFADSAARSASLTAPSAGMVTYLTSTNSLEAYNGSAYVPYAPLASPTFTGTPTLPTGTIATTQTAGNSTTAVATTAFVTTADNLKANLASPSLTGTPLAPTASVGTNTTQIATTAFTKAEIATIGAWTSFTPSYTNLTTGNGTSTGVYAISNKILWVQTAFTLGSTSAVGDPVRLTLPASLTTSTTVGTSVGHAVFNDAGVATYTGIVQVNSTTQVQPFVTNVSATYATLNSLNGTRPFSSFSGDQYFMEFMVQLT